MLDDDGCRVEFIAQLTVDTLLPCAVSITTILLGDVVEHAMKSPRWLSQHAINLWITINKNHITWYMIPVRTHDVNSLSPQCKRAVTVALCYVTQIKKVSVVNQLTMTMKPHECSIDLWNVNLSITRKYVTIPLE